MPPEARRTLLVQFAKSPVRGGVKSRMVPHLSPDQALALHCELVRWTTRRLVESALGPVQVAVAGDMAHAVFVEAVALGAGEVVPQSGADLGERMYRALAAGLRKFDKVLLVGSDCPGLDRAYLHAAQSALDGAEVVLGPAVDGGYVLIGAKSISPTVFCRIDWGTSSVFRQTTERLDEAGVSWLSVAARRDIDRPEDLPYWQAVRAERGACSRRSGRV
jgi:hypothetical protein